MDTPKNALGLYKKLSNVMKAIGRIPKDGYNDFHRYYYTTEATLSEHIRGILVENGIGFFSNVEEQERNGEFTKVKMVFTLVDLETGEKLESTYWGEGQDKSDKGLYKAYTGATKYFLMKTFLIPTGDDPEAEAAQPKKAPQKQNTQPNKQQANAKPATQKQSTGQQPGKCSNPQCRKPISAGVVTFSTKKYGKPLCQDCQKAVQEKTSA